MYLLIRKYSGSKWIELKEYKIRQKRNAPLAISMKNRGFRCNKMFHGISTSDNMLPYKLDTILSNRIFSNKYPGVVNLVTAYSVKFGVLDLIFRTLFQFFISIYTWIILWCSLVTDISHCFKAIILRFLLLMPYVILTLIAYLLIRLKNNSLIAQTLFLVSLISFENSTLCKPIFFIPSLS